jgi:hypothetical protein
MSDAFTISAKSSKLDVGGAYMYFGLLSFSCGWEQNLDIDKYLLLGIGFSLAPRPIYPKIDVTLTMKHIADTAAHCSAIIIAYIVSSRIVIYLTLKS